MRQLLHTLYVPYRKHISANSLATLLIKMGGLHINLDGRISELIKAYLASSWLTRGEINNNKGT